MRHRIRLLTLAIAGLVVAAPAFAQDPAVPTTVPEMWTAWCARCHAADGSGKVAMPTVAVEPLDFSDCKVATAEPDADWEVAIKEGGPAVGLSSQMPAFGDVLTEAQVGEFVALLRTFCKESGWPSGNLNFPRPIFAEKAFPENEMVFLPAASHRQNEPTQFAMKTVYERRLGKRAQLELVLPLESVRGAGSQAARHSGISDAEVGLKVALTPARASYLGSFGFDVVLPTGRESRGLGGGTTVFEPYLAGATMLGQAYLQAQVKLEMAKGAPFSDRTTVFHVYLGRDTSGYPNTWTLGLELNGENDELALTPQIRKGLTRTGALAGAIGVRLPLNHRKEQGIRWVGYLLWEYLEPVFPGR